MKKFMKKYGFITLMLLGIVAGCIVGAAWPGATALEPFGTLFINMMFCVVVPMVFCSIASAIANMSSAKRAGRIMGITVGTFLSTAAIAAILMYIIVHFIPVFTAAPSYEESGVGTVDIGTLIVNFFTKPDFTELWEPPRYPSADRCGDHLRLRHSDVAAAASPAWRCCSMTSRTFS